MKKVKNNINSIFLGLLDAILPNFKNCFKEIKSEFITDEDYIEVNWLRLFVSLITFTLLVLNFFKIIEIQDVIKLIETFNELK
jgi:hypothetical protein